MRLPYLDWRFYNTYIVSPYIHYKLFVGRLQMIWFDASFSEFCQKGLSNLDGSATLSAEWHSSLLIVSNLNHVLNTTVQWAYLLYDGELEQVGALWHSSFSACIKVRQMNPSKWTKRKQSIHFCYTYMGLGSKISTLQIIINVLQVSFHSQWCQPSMTRIVRLQHQNDAWYAYTVSDWSCD